MSIIDEYLNTVLAPEVDPQVKIDPTHLTGIGMEGWDGSAELSDMERDFLQMDAYTFDQKYGQNVGNSLRAQMGTNATEYLADTVPERSWGEAAYDTVSGVLGGAVTGVTGAGAWLAGEINPEWGNALSNITNKINEGVRSTQSDVINRRRIASQVREHALNVDNERKYQRDLASGMSEGEANLAKIGRDAVNFAKNAFTDETLLAQNIADTSGSFLAGNIAGAGIKGLAKLGAKATGTKALSKLADKYSFEAGMGAMEGGGQYVDTMSSVMAMSSAELYETSTEYADRVREYMLAGLTQAEAEERAKLDLAEDTAETTARATGAAAVMLNRALAGGSKAIAEKRSSNFLADYAKGAIGEAPEEMGTNVVGQLSSNYATQQYINPEQELTEGLGSAAVEGALYGPFGALTAPVVNAPVAMAKGTYEAVKGGIETKQAETEANTTLAEQAKAYVDAHQITFTPGKTDPSDAHARTNLGDKVLSTLEEDRYKDFNTNNKEDASALKTWAERQSDTFILGTEDTKKHGTTNRFEATMNAAKNLKKEPTKENAESFLELASRFVDDASYLQEGSLVGSAINHLNFKSEDIELEKAIKDHTSLTLSVINNEAFKRSYEQAVQVAQKQAGDSASKIKTEADVTGTEGQALIKTLGTLAKSNAVTDLVYPDAKGNAVLSDETLNALVAVANRSLASSRNPEMPRKDAELVIALHKLRQLHKQQWAKGNQSLYTSKQKLVHTQISDSLDVNNYDSGMISSMQHTNAIIRALYNGDLTTARTLHRRQGQFVRSMINKSNAFYDYTQLPEDKNHKVNKKGRKEAIGVAYSYYDPKKNTFVPEKESTHKVFAIKDSPASVEQARITYRDAHLVADEYNLLTTSFPELHGSEFEIEPTNLPKNHKHNRRALINYDMVNDINYDTKDITTGNKVAPMSTDNRTEAEVQASVQASIQEVDATTAQSSADDMQALQYQLKQQQDDLQKIEDDLKKATDSAEKAKLNQQKVTLKDDIQDTQDAISQANTNKQRKERNKGRFAKLAEYVQNAINQTFYSIINRGLKVRKHPSLIWKGAKNGDVVQYVNTVLSDEAVLDKHLEMLSDSTFVSRIKERLAKAEDREALVQYLNKILPKIISIMNDRLAKANLDKSDAASVNDPDSDLYSKIKVFAFANRPVKLDENGQPILDANGKPIPDGSYTYIKGFAEASALAALDFMLNQGGLRDRDSSKIEEETDGAQYYKGTTAKQRKEYDRAVKHGIPERELPLSLERYLRDYLSLEDKKNVGSGLNQALIMSLASEMIKVLETAGYVKKTEVKFATPDPNVPKSKNYYFIELNTKAKPPEFLAQYRAVLGDLFNLETGDRSYYNEQKPPVIDTILHSFVKLTAYGKKVIRNWQDKKYYYNSDFADQFVDRLGQNIVYMLGAMATDKTRNFFNETDLQAEEDRNSVYIRALEEMQNIKAEMQAELKRMRDAGDSKATIDKVYRRYQDRLINVGRSQQQGSVTPQANKLIREIMSATRSEMNFSSFGTDNESKEVGYYKIALAQAFGMKVENAMITENTGNVDISQINDFINKIIYTVNPDGSIATENGKRVLNPKFKEIMDHFNMIRTKGNELTPEELIQYRQDIENLGIEISPRSLSHLEDLCRLVEAIEADKPINNWTTFVHIEADGKTNGTANQLINLLGGFFGPQSIKRYRELMAKVGVVLPDVANKFTFLQDGYTYASIKGLAEKMGDKFSPKDYYQDVASKTTEIIDKTFAEGEHKNVRKHITTLLNLFGMVDSEGALARAAVKTPVMSILYGSGMRSIVNNLYGQIEAAFNSRLTEASLNHHYHPDWSMAQCFFPEDSAEDATKKFNEFLEAMNYLSTHMFSKGEVTENKKDVPTVDFKKKVWKKIEKKKKDGTVETKYKPDYKKGFGQPDWDSLKTFDIHENAEENIKNLFMEYFGKPVHKVIKDDLETNNEFIDTLNRANNIFMIHWRGAFLTEIDAFMQSQGYDPKAGFTQEWKQQVLEFTADKFAPIMGTSFHNLLTKANSFENFKSSIGSIAEAEQRDLSAFASQWSSLEISSNTGTAGGSINGIEGFSTPTYAGVSLKPNMNLAYGDALMMMMLSQFKKSLHVFDGFNIALDSIKEYGKAANFAVLMTWRHTNAYKDMYRRMKEIRKNLTPKDLQDIYGHLSDEMLGQLACTVAGVMPQDSTRVTRGANGRTSTIRITLSQRELYDISRGALKIKENNSLYWEDGKTLVVKLGYNEIADHLDVIENAIKNAAINHEAFIRTLFSEDRFLSSDQMSSTEEPLAFGDGSNDQTLYINYQRHRLNILNDPTWIDRPNDIDWSTAFDLANWKDSLQLSKPLSTSDRGKVLDLGLQGLANTFKGKLSPKNNRLWALVQKRLPSNIRVVTLASKRKNSVLDLLDAAIQNNDISDNSIFTRFEQHGYDPDNAPIRGWVDTQSKSIYLVDGLNDPVTTLHELVHYVASDKIIAFYYGQKDKLSVVEQSAIARLEKNTQQFASLNLKEMFKNTPLTKKQQDRMLEAQREIQGYLANNQIELAVQEMSAIGSSEDFGEAFDKAHNVKADYSSLNRFLRTIFKSIRDALVKLVFGANANVNDTLFNEIFFNTGILIASPADINQKLTTYNLDEINGYNIPNAIMSEYKATNETFETEALPKFYADMANYMSDTYKNDNLRKSIPNQYEQYKANMRNPLEDTPAVNPPSVFVTKRDNEAEKNRYGLFDVTDDAPVYKRSLARVADIGTDIQEVSARGYLRRYSK